jgi:hypothetical protein
MSGETLDQKQLRIVNQCKMLMPPSFIINSNDTRIAAFIDLVIGDFNMWPPMTGYDLSNLPAQYETIVKFGVEVFTLLFLQQTWTLQDFGWSDGGISLNLDRVTKIDTAYKNSLEMYKNIILNAKKYEIIAMGGRGIGSPRYQSQIGQFLKIALSGSFNWNQP